MLRHLATALAAYLVLAPAASAQWVQQSPVTSGLRYKAVHATSPDVAFVVGENSEWDEVGAMHITRDGGDTWTNTDFPASWSPLNDVFFLDDQRGWAVGNDNYRTTDGGQTWQALPFLGSMNFVRFYTPSFGYAWDNHKSFVSHDGGLSWEPSAEETYGFDFRDGSVGLAALRSGIHRTTDGGQTFALVRPDSSRAVAFLGESVAVALTGGAVVRSTDAGQTWSAAAEAPGLTTFARLSDGVALAFGGRTGTAAEAVLRTADGGATWAAVEDLAEGVNHVVRLDDQAAVAVVGGHSVYRSEDGGATWTRTYTAPLLGFGAYDVSFANEDVGYMVSGFGLVLKSVDGGRTWGQVSNGYGADLYDVARVTDDRLVAVGYDGTVLVTDNRGAKWRLVEDGVEMFHHNRAVDYVGGGFVAAVTDWGQLVTSEDDGETWDPTGVPVLPQGDFNAYDLRFTTPLDGWVSGIDALSPRSRIAWHTTDGGQTWTAPFEALGLALGVAVEVEGDRVWALQANGRLWRSTDSGMTWTHAMLPDGGAGSLVVEDVEFVDETTGYVAGWYGYAAKTTDGGATWTRLDMGPTGEAGGKFSDVYVLGEGEVWMSTHDDRVYHSTDGGTTWTSTAIGSDPLAFESFSGVVATADGMVWAAGFKGHIYALGGPDPIVGGIPYVTTAVESEGAGGPTRLVAYPNPFSRRATLELDVPAGERVRVAAFDVLGREVAVLHDGALVAGSHRFTFDAAGLPSGVYVLRAAGETVVATQRVTLAR
jgi:photosystem II stability/assembly factor-like uncharacterized protein